MKITNYKRSQIRGKRIQLGRSPDGLKLYLDSLQETGLIIKQPRFIPINWETSKYNTKHIKI